MPNRPAISKNELEVLRIVWELGQSSVRQAHEALPEARKMDFTTVQTYLSRLEDKGYLSSKKVGRAKVFKPKVRPKSVINEAIDDFVTRLFGGEPMPLIRHMIADRKISDEELAELRKLINEYEE